MEWFWITTLTGDLVGIDIDHASQKLEIKEIILRP